MGQALYRKYRPKVLSDLVGQEHVTLTLSNALKNGQVSHAYLFTGPRGVGKTSVARILAHEVNGLPYDEESSHLDIIEIDAASNRRIDEIRQLRERINLAPTSSKYKVYIIDEVHMLTKEAFNALLKTLEEPPQHVIFILATTEAYRVPETITSRTQQFKFRPIPTNQMAKQLAKIAAAEKIKVDEAALNLVAEHGDGSFRDSLSLLDQTSNTGSVITLEQVERLLGIAPNKVIDDVISAVARQSMPDIVKQASLIDEAGHNISLICKQLNKKLQSELISSAPQIDRAIALKLMKQLIDVPSSTDPLSSLEIALLDATLGVSATNQQTLPGNSPINETRSPSVQPAKNETAKAPPAPENKSITSKTAKFDLEIWDEVLASIKAHHNTLYTMVKLAVPEIKGDHLVLRSKYPFHQRKLIEAKNQNIIAGAVKDLTDQTIIIECIVDENLEVRERPKKGETTDHIENISNIFGSAEVLE
jgi:DNA polymerase III subunit gamma/tau